MSRSLFLLFIAVSISGCSTVILIHPTSKQTVRCPGGNKTRQDQCIAEYENQGFILTGASSLGGFEF
jgi:uncharacterized protein YceK